MFMKRIHLKRQIGFFLFRVWSWAKRMHGEVQTENLRRNGSEGSVGGDVVLAHAENISIGKNSYVNGGMLAASPNAEISIGSNCLISYGVHMRTDMHRHDLFSETPMIDQGLDEKSIRIGDNVWIGFGAQIMSGVSVGSNSIIAAGAVVTKNVPSYEVWGGIPARRLR